MSIYTVEAFGVKLNVDVEVRKVSNDLGVEGSPDATYLTVREVKVSDSGIDIQGLLNPYIMDVIESEVSKQL